MHQLSHNKGFMIPLALFILVSMAALAIAINRMAAQSTSSSTLEGVSLQAFFAAESGAQYAMHFLMFDVTQRSESDNNCSTMPLSVPNFPHASAAGLQACSLSLSCQQDSVSTSSASYYTITSTAECGSGTLQAKRTIEVSAYL